VTNYERFLAIDGQIFVPGSGNFLPQRVLENRGDTLLRRARRSNDGDAVKRNRVWHSSPNFAGSSREGKAYPGMSERPALASHGGRSVSKPHTSCFAGVIGTAHGVLPDLVPLTRPVLGHDPIV
jgi:hypothetical protein